MRGDPGRGPASSKGSNGRGLGARSVALCVFWVEYGTFCVEETRLPAVVHHLLLALLRSRHQGPELLRRGAVVELHHVGFAQRGALNRDGGRTVVHQNGPHLFL